MNRDRETYDRMCDEADAILAKYNPCANCEGCHLINPQPYDCCKGCPLLGPNGCTTRCLGCKLWLCGTKESHYDDDLTTELNELTVRAARLNFNYARALPEEILALQERHGVWHIYNEMKRAPEYNFPIKLKKE